MLSAAARVAAAVIAPTVMMGLINFKCRRKTEMMGQKPQVQGQVYTKYDSSNSKERREDCKLDKTNSRTNERAGHQDVS